MRYGELIERSLSIFWRYKYLWVLGALGGGEAVGGGGIGNLSTPFQGGGGDGSGQPPGPLPGEIGSWVADHLILLISLAALVALFAVVYFVVSCVASGAAVRAAAEHDAGRPFDFRLAWRAGTSTFGAVLGLRLLGLLLLLLALAMVGGMAALVALSILRGHQEAVPAAVILGAVLIPALAVIGIALSLTWTLALRAIVLERLGVFDALERGFQLLRRRLGRMLLLWLIGLVMGVVASVAVSIAGGVLVLPFAALVGVAYLAAGLQAALSAGAVLVVLYFVGLVLLSGAAGSYLTSYWTLAFRRLDLDLRPEPFQPRIQTPGSA